MNIIKILYCAVTSPLKVINRAQIKGRLSASLMIVFLAALAGAVLAPLAYNFTYKDVYVLTLNSNNNFVMFIAGISTFLAECLVFWLFSIIFKKEASFKQFVSTWGLSFIANLICILTYFMLQLSDIRTYNTIFAFLISTFFIILLVWKAIYYFIEMKLVMKATAFELVIITFICGMIFTVLMMVNSFIGIQIPML